MKIDFVDPVAESVVRTEARRILVRFESKADRLAGGRRPGERAHLGPGPRGPFPLQRLVQGGVAGERIVVLEGGRLVLHLVRRHARTVAPRRGGCPRAASICLVNSARPAEAWTRM